LPATDPCPCRSEFSLGVCHAPANTYAFEPSARSLLKYAIPAHIGDAQAADVARSLQEAGPYSVTTAGRLWHFGHGGPLRPFTILPLLRDRAKDGTPDSYLVRPAFEGIQNWPPGPYPSEAEHSAAEQALVKGMLTWDVDRLFEIRDAVGSLIHHATADALEERLPRMVTAIKTALPSATLDVVRSNLRALGAAAIVRNLSLFQEIHPQTIAGAYSSDSSSYGAPYYFFHPAPHYELLANINFPQTHAFGVRLGLEAYLIVDYGQDVTLDPLEASERRARDIGGRLLMTPRGDSFTTRGFPEFTPARRHFLRAWVTSRLNYLYSHLTALCAAPVGENDCIDPTPLFKDLLTLEDIVALTQLIATSSDPALRRLLFFDLVDRYVQLGGASRRADAILNDDKIAAIIAALDPGLQSARPAVADYLQESWARVGDGLWAGILDPAARAAGALNVHAPGQPERVLPRAALLPELLVALRNATHGYHLRSRTFEQFLTRHSGMLPDDVRELAIGLWFGLLSSPVLFWPDASRFNHMVRVGTIPE
jgi:hypothetical protein